LDEIPKNILTQIENIASKISECDYIDEENFDKFIEYYGTKEAISNFRADFIEISDDEKNYSLYIDPHADSRNQFLVHLTLTQKDNNGDEISQKQYEEYISTKKIKIMTHKRLANRLQKYVKATKIARQNFNPYLAHFNLSQSHLNWIFNSQNNDSAEILKILSTEGVVIREILRKVENTMHVLFNVFNRYFT